MQISNNYQIFPNKNYVNCSYKNSLQYQGQNMTFGQKSLTSLPKQLIMSFDEQCKKSNILLCKYMPCFQTKKQYQTALQEQYLNAVEHCKKDAEQIFNRNIVFGPEEYKNLSNEDLTTLRKYIDLFYKTDILYNYESEFKCANFIKSFGKLFSERLHEKYPDGFIFVSVGRSPAFLAKYMEFQGEEVKYCPFSGLHYAYGVRFSSDFVQEYKKYLNTIGLTKELTRNTQKPIIITDYVENGFTLDYFRKLLASPKIGIKEGEMVKYSPITPHSRFEKDNWIFKDEPIICDEFGKYGYREFMGNERTKPYTSIPYTRMYVDDMYETSQTYYQNGNRFKENFDTKMMNFIIADSIYNR